MISKLGRGTNFMGLGAYLLHDKEGKTSERVAFTETRNLATNKASAAISVMSATAMDQTRLKREAGIKATGRKSRESVLHVTLSWHPDEAEALTKDEMLRAADGAIAALGANDHQALVVGHSDSEHPHVHLVINRISADDGRMLSSSKEKLKLSKWALEYEKARGAVLCKERELNAAARDRGHFTRGLKGKPRHIFELEAANDNHEEAAQVRDGQREFDRPLRREDALATRRHSDAWRDLDQQHKDDRAALSRDRRSAVERAKAQAVDDHRGEWRALQEKHDEENTAFEAREASLMGKAANAWRSIDWRGFLSSEKRQGTIKESFSVISSKGARLEKAKAAQEAEKRKIRLKEASAKKAAAATVVHEFKQRALQLRSKCLLDRTHLEFTQSLEKAAIRAKWRARGEQRKAAWAALERRSEQREKDLKADKRSDHPKKALAHMGRMRAAMNERAAAPGEPRSKDSRDRQATAVNDRSQEVADGFKRLQEQRSKNLNDMSRDDRGR